MDNPGCDMNKAEIRGQTSYSPSECEDVELASWTCCLWYEIMAMIYLRLLKIGADLLLRSETEMKWKHPMSHFYVFIMFWTQRQSLSLVDLVSWTFIDLTSRRFWFTCACFVSHVNGVEICALHWQRECWEHPILCEACNLSLVSFHLQAYKMLELR